MAQEHLAEQYDRNASCYDDAAYFNRFAAGRLVSCVPEGEYRDLLDVGSGTGFATLAALERFPTIASVTGLDVSAGMLEQFREKLADHPGLAARLIEDDVGALVGHGVEADLALCCMALHWFTDRAAAIAAIAGSLRPGGVLALVSPGPGHDQEYVALVQDLDPPVPAHVHEVFAASSIDPDVVERQLVEAGLEPLDVWVETRHRTAPAERYLGRMRAVGSHTWHAIMEPAEVEAMLARIEAAVRAGSGPGGWRYTFTKTFAVARRP